MPVLPIITLPDPMLRQVSEPVERIDADVRRLVEDMFETMRKAPGIGLAAVQVAVPRRVIVLEVTPEGGLPEPITMINPEILTLGDERRIHDEGCLSLPDVRYDVERPATVKVRYTDLDGRIITRDADGLLATAIQHELDHLDGKLIIDFMSKLRRDMVVRKLKKLALRSV